LFLNGWIESNWIQHYWRKPKWEPYWIQIQWYTSQDPTGFNLLLNWSPLINFFILLSGLSFFNGWNKIAFPVNWFHQCHGMPFKWMKWREFIHQFQSIPIHSISQEGIPINSIFSIRESIQYHLITGISFPFTVRGRGNPFNLITGNSFPFTVRGRGNPLNSI